MSAPEPTSAAPQPDPTAGWLDAPIFDGLSRTENAATGDHSARYQKDQDEERAEWADIDDHDRLLRDGHLSDLGVSVLADLQAGVPDAAFGLDAEAVRTTILHLAACVACPARVAIVGSWARSIADPVIEPTSTAEPVSDPAAEPTAEPTLSPGQDAAVHSSNVISLQRRRTRYFTPRYAASAAAVLAACTFGASALFANSARVTSANLAGEAAETAAAADTTAAAAAEAAAAPETVAGNFAGVASEEAASARAAMESATSEGAPGAGGTTAHIPTDDEAVSFDSAVGGQIDTAGGTSPPLARKSALPPGGAPPARSSEPPTSSDLAPPAPAALAPAVRPTTTVTADRSGVGSATLAEPAAEAAATTTSDLPPTPNLLGKYLSVSEVAAKLRADPTLALADVSTPCADALRVALTVSGVEQAPPRFVRALVGDRMVTFAVATPVGKAPVVVAVDDACRPVT